MEETGKILQGYSVIETSVVKEEIQHSTHFTEQRKERKRSNQDIDAKIMELRIRKRSILQNLYRNIY